MGVKNFKESAVYRKAFSLAMEIFEISKSFPTEEKYSLTDQVDWDSALREDNGNVNPLGLYDLDRNIRPVGKAYKQLIKDWREVLPTQSVCLNLPIQLPFDNKQTKQANENAEQDNENKRDATTLLQAGKIEP